MLSDLLRFCLFVILTGVFSFVWHVIFSVPDTFIGGAGTAVVTLLVNGGFLFLWDWVSNYKIVRKTASDYLPN